VLARGGGCVRAGECVETGVETDGGLRVLGRGSFGALCCGVRPDTKGTSATASSTDEASRPGPAEVGECGVGFVAVAVQAQATKGAAEREAAWEPCGCDREEGGRMREHG
jgi:hypothetical protein